jgi:hypothetical protein
MFVCLHLNHFVCFSDFNVLLLLGVSQLSECCFEFCDAGVELVVSLLPLMLHFVFFLHRLVDFSLK